MENTIELYGSNGVSKIGIKFNDAKPVVYVALGFVLGALAVNYIINNQKRQN